MPSNKAPAKFYDALYPKKTMTDPVEITWQGKEIIVDRSSVPTTYRGIITDQMALKNEIESWGESQKLTSSTAYSPQQYDHSFAFQLVGDAGVGKSSLLLRYTQDKFEADPWKKNTNVDFAKNCEFDVGEVKVRADIYDIPGRESYQNPKKKSTYFRDPHCLILLVDVTDKISFNDVKRYLKDQQYVHTFKSDISMILVSTKVDCDKGNRQVEKDELDALAIEFGIKHIETSAKKGINAKQVFQTAAKIVLERLHPQKISITQKETSLLDHLVAAPRKYTHTAADYKKALLKYLDERLDIGSKIPVSSEKHKFLGKIQEEISTNQELDIDALKGKIQLVRTEVAKHRDEKGIQGKINRFFNRNTASLNKLNEIFDEDNNLNEGQILEFAQSLQPRF